MNVRDGPHPRKSNVRRPLGSFLRRHISGALGRLEETIGASRGRATSTVGSQARTHPDAPRLRCRHDSRRTWSPRSGRRSADAVTRAHSSASGASSVRLQPDDSLGRLREHLLTARRRASCRSRPPPGWSAASSGRSRPACSCPEASQSRLRPTLNWLEGIEKPVATGLMLPAGAERPVATGLLLPAGAERPAATGLMLPGRSRRAVATGMGRPRGRREPPATLDVIQASCAKLERQRRAFARVPRMTYDLVHLERIARDRNG